MNLGMVTIWILSLPKQTLYWQLNLREGSIYTFGAESISLSAVIYSER